MVVMSFRQIAGNTATINIATRAEMRRAVRLTLVVGINAIIATVSYAQTNSCVSSTGGFWQEAQLWSLANTPSIDQAAILITNAPSATVTIDDITAYRFISTMTVSNLSVSPPSGCTDSLYLNNTGAIAMRILNSLAVGVSCDNTAAGGSALITTNSTVIVDGLSGGQLVDNGTIAIIDGALITTNCPLEIGASVSSFSSAAGFLLISNSIGRARDVTITSGDSSGGEIEIIGGMMSLSSFLSVGDGLANSFSSMLVANGGFLVVTNDETDIGGFYESSGSLTVSDATFLATDIFLGGTRSDGELTINNGTVTVSGQLGIGDSEQGLGAVSLNGGQLVVTNGETDLGVGTPSGGDLAVSDGLFLARDVYVGAYEAWGALTIDGGTSILSSNLQVGSGNSEATVSVTGGQLFVTNAPIVVDYQAQCSIAGGQLAAKTIELGDLTGGTLTIEGGSVTVSEGITLGDCNHGFVVGTASVDGGQLIVTNAAGTGFIDVQNGQLILASGVLHVDKLVMTNSCSSFMHTGGVLVVGSMVLDPNAFRITSVARESNDLRVTWMMGPGQVNALQATSGGVYNSNNFADIFIVTNNTTLGFATNYLDVGAATNTPCRFYRARLTP
jgi:hypothetical protein